MGGKLQKGTSKNDRRRLARVGKKGGILKALRRAPLVGVALELVRPARAGRKVDLP